jgi:hypothetical protein
MWGGGFTCPCLDNVSNNDHACTEYNLNGTDYMTVVCGTEPSWDRTLIGPTAVMAILVPVRTWFRFLVS